MSKTFEGSCLCSGVQFSVESFSEKAANCHCSMCRKFHGAAFGTLVEVTGLTWHSGKDLLKDYTSPNGTIRTFCSVCGSSLGFRVKGAPLDKIELALGTFSVDIPVKINAQIYTSYKTNWCNLEKGIPVYGEGRS